MHRYEKPTDFCLSVFGEHMPTDTLREFEISLYEALEANTLGDQHAELIAVERSHGRPPRTRSHDTGLSTKKKVIA